MNSWDSDFESVDVYEQPNDFSPVAAAFWMLWASLGLNTLLVLVSYLFRPPGLESLIWLASFWFLSFTLMIAGYYVFSVVTQKRKLNPDYGTPQSSETRSRLAYLVLSFMATIFAAYPLAYELSRLVRFE